MDFKDLIDGLSHTESKVLLDSLIRIAEKVIEIAEEEERTESEQLSYELGKKVGEVKEVVKRYYRKGFDNE